MDVQRSKPNVLITGTPGVGKSSVCKKLAKQLHYDWVEVSKVATDNDCLDGYDEALKCPILDEDKLLDILEIELGHGGKIVDYHGCDLFPERWFDAVFVLRCENNVLYNRLKARDYVELKITNNIDSEIFQTILMEAQESYKEEIVFELQNSTKADMKKNLITVKRWIKNYIENCL